MTTEYAVRHPADPALYADAMRSLHEADDAITTLLRAQARQRETLRQVERQLAELRTDVQIDVAEDAAQGGRGSRLGNAEGREAELRHRLAQHPRAQQLQQVADEAAVTLAELEVQLDAAVRQRKGALASLNYAAAWLTYAATEEKPR